MELKKRILVAPLNWGLGHATRCIPIINTLSNHGYEPVIASDGHALDLLKQEFPNLQCLELPSYNISYAKKGKHFKLKLFINSPKTLKAIIAEKKVVKNLVLSGKVHGIISDNRLGVISKKVPSVFITHQLHVLSGSTTWLSSKIHKHFIKKYNECWIPDVEFEPSLSGMLGHLTKPEIKVKYLGVLSRFNKIEVDIAYDLFVLLSGPEPQRTFLEHILVKQLKEYKGRVLFVKGLISNKKQTLKKDHITYVNYMNSKELELAINQSKIIVSRSGYSTILDLAKLGKRAFFIPTPGQYEQEYLANRLEQKKIAPFSTQENFRINMLQEIEAYSGFKNLQDTQDHRSLFSLFECE